MAAARGVTAVHDKDGWLGAARFWQRLRDDDALTLRVWQSLPHEHLDRLSRRGPASRARRPVPAGRLPQGLHGRDARLADGADARRLRRGDHERRRARGHRPAGCSSRLARRGARDRRSRKPRGARRVRARRRSTGARRAFVTGSSTRNAWPRRTCRATPLSAWPRRCSSATHPSDRDLAERFWPEQLAGTYAFRTLVESGALVANGSDAPIEELDPWAGICAGVLRTLDDRPAWRPEQAVTLEQALHATIVAPAWLSGDERRRGKLLPGYFADLVVLDRDPLECDPSELPGTYASWRPWSAGAGCTNPPPWS